MVDYYQRLTAQNGPKTNAFARLFLVPGMGHCAGGAATDSIDGLGKLVDWVEKGQPPKSVPASGTAVKAYEQGIVQRTVLVEFDSVEQAVAAPFDISIDESVAALMTTAVGEFGGLDLLHGLAYATPVAAASAMASAIDVSSVHSPGANAPIPPPIMSMTVSGRGVVNSYPAPSASPAAVASSTAAVAAGRIGRSAGPPWW